LLATELIDGLVVVLQELSGSLELTWGGHDMTGIACKLDVRERECPWRGWNLALTH